MNTHEHKITRLRNISLSIIVGLPALAVVLIKLLPKETRPPEVADLFWLQEGANCDEAYSFKSADRKAYEEHFKK